MALKQKITKVKALNKFRENLDVRLKQRYESRPIGSKDIVKTLSESLLFGKGNRPDLPIKTLICGEYGNSTEQLYEEKAK